MRPQRGGRRDSRDKKDTPFNVGWIPKTRLGQLVYQGKITTMSEALASRYPLKEPQIVDILLPEMEDEVLDVNMVQRMTDSGRRVRFAITAVVGNQDGFVGMGRAKGREVGPAIRNAIDRAKINLIEVKRGCGSWECGCQNPHTFPFAVSGKCGSVNVTLKPAPRGVGLALGDVAKKVIGMAGIQDAWGFAKGHTKTTVNYSFAAFEALRETARIKVTETQAKNLHITTGPMNTVYLETSPEEMKRVLEEKKQRVEEKIEDVKKAVTNGEVKVMDEKGVKLDWKDDKAGSKDKGDRNAEKKPEQKDSPGPKAQGKPPESDKREQKSPPEQKVEKKPELQKPEENKEAKPSEDKKPDDDKTVKPPEEKKPVEEKKEGEEK
jgi:small subunit ribosomal protein S5